MADFTFITGPRECHGVRSPEEYLRIQADFLQRLVASGRVAPVGLFEAVEIPLPYISAGRWVLDCPCGNAPSVSVDWDLACCFECGAIYRNMLFPDKRVRLEKQLIKQKRVGRTWHPSMGERILTSFLEDE